MDIHLGAHGAIKLGNFNALQAYKVARKLECDGIAFYEAMLREDVTPDVRRALSYLLESERNHLDFFERAIDREQSDAMDGFEEDDIVDYLTAHVFPHANASPAATPTALLTMGLNMEQRSIAFYTALAEQTTDPAGKGALDNIIREEQKHRDMIQQLV